MASAERRRPRGIAGPLRARPRRLSTTPLPAAAGAYPKVYAVVKRIPRGRVATYGQVAAEAGMPSAPRVAGYALHALPPGSPIPWHRVVAAGGKLSLGKLDPSGATTQRLRLEHEGVRFDGRGCVDMARHSWRPRLGARDVAPASGSAVGDRSARRVPSLRCVVRDSIGKPGSTLRSRPSSRSTPSRSARRGRSSHSA